MRSISYLPQLLTVFVVSAAAAAQSPWGFPLNQSYVASSINGEIIADRAPTLTVARDPNNEQVLRGSGFAGCNSWMGAVTLNQNRFGVGNVGTTKMYCADRMATESSFLQALQSTKRWHLEGASLVLEGDKTLVL